MPCGGRRNVWPDRAFLSRVLKMKAGLCFLSAILLLLPACQRVPESISRFCIQDRNAEILRRIFKTEHIDIDLAGRRMSGGDVSDHIELVEADRYFGMMSPLALIVPRSNLPTSPEAVIRVNHRRLSLTFRVSDSKKEKGKYSGEVYKKDIDGRLSRVLTYRYTTKKGVYEIQADPALGISSSQLTLRKCGGAPLFAQ